MLNFKDTKEQLERTLNLDSLVKKKTFSVLNKQAVIYFSDGLTDSLSLNQFVLQPLESFSQEGDFSFSRLKSVLPFVDMLEMDNIGMAILAVYDGDSLLFIDGMNSFAIISSKMWDKRMIAEPPTSTVIKGPREGFVEDFMLNISLLKRRLKTPMLKIQFLKVGKFSRTNVAVIHIEGVAKNSLVEKIVKKINAISIDGVLDSSYLRQYLVNKPNSIFRQVGDTEKPDILASRLLEGRVALIVDGSPIILTLPYIFIEDLQTAEDYYTIPYFANFLRVLRVLAMCCGVFMPAFFVCAQVFHPQFLPLNLLLTISSSTKNIPLPPTIEMLFTLFLFELLTEASTRMPKYVGISMSIVGAIVLGDTAVNAGLISTPTILVTAISGIAVYAIPNHRDTLSLLRLIYLILAGSFGIVGLAVAVFLTLIYLCTIDNFDTPYLAPYSPIISCDKADGILKSPEVISKNRPEVFRSKNIVRKG